MNLKHLLLIAVLFVVSCIEDLEPLESNFEKVFGFNNNALANGISKNANGSFLLFGWAERTVTNFNDLSRATKVSQMPILIQVDQNGNEITTRSYPMGKVDYQFNPVVLARQLDINMDIAEFRDAVEMSNGKYLITFSGFDQGDNWVVWGYVVLDRNFNMEKVQLLGDFEEEFQEPPYILRATNSVMFFNSPERNEVLLLTDCSFNIDGAIIPFGPCFYSIIRLSLDGTLIDYSDYNMNSKHMTPTDMIFDNEGNAIVIGRTNFSGANIFIHKIDLKTGDLLQESELTTGSAGISEPRILPSDDGYVLAEVGELSADEPIYRVFSLSFLDQDFNFLNRIFYPAGEFNECWIRSFIPMKSGGFSALTYTCNGPMTVFRLDQKGNELWRWTGEFDGNDGSLIGDLAEASDGGIIFVRSEEFNSTGHKIKLIKFDTNGNI